MGVPLCLQSDDTTNQWRCIKGCDMYEIMMFDSCRDECREIVGGRRCFSVWVDRSGESPTLNSSHIRNYGIGCCRPIIARSYLRGSKRTA
jgi:hypothetical protein